MLWLPSYPPWTQPTLWLEHPRKCKGKWRSGHHEYPFTQKSPGHSHTEVLRSTGQRGTPRGPWCQPLVTPNQFPGWHSVANEATVVFSHFSTLIHTRKLRPSPMLTHPGCRQISFRGCGHTQELACSTGSSGSAWNQNGSRIGWEGALLGTRIRVALGHRCGSGMDSDTSGMSCLYLLATPSQDRYSESMLSSHGLESENFEPVLPICR